MIQKLKYIFAKILSVIGEWGQSMLSSEKNSVNTVTSFPLPPISVTQIDLSKQTDKSKKLYETAKNCLGQSLVPPELAELGCALTVNELAKRAWGYQIGGGASTHDMLPFLQDENFFETISEKYVQPGDIIISPTGSLGSIFAHGHVGIIALYGILSNDSRNGQLHEAFTLDSWKRYYRDVGKFPVLFFRAL